MIGALINALSAGLSLWNHKERNKYRDRLAELKREYYAEYNKPADLRSDAVLDHVEFELRILASGFAASVGEQDPQA